MKNFVLLFVALVLLGGCTDDAVTPSEDKQQYIYFLTDTFNLKAREMETYYARMDTNGENRQYLMRLWNRMENATYSPDGKKVVLDVYENRTVMNIDGTDRRFFAKANGFEWSPDSRFVAHWNTDSLMVTDVNTLESKLVCTDKYFSKAVWAHDSKTLYYIKKDSIIVSVQTDGSGRNELLKAVKGSEIHYISDITASLRENLLLFIFKNAVTDEAGIGSMKPDGTVIKTVNSDKFFAFKSWSPDGKKFLAPGYSATSRSLNEIDVQTLFVKELLSHEGKGVFAPAYSPDGKRITFTLGETTSLYQSTKSRILIMNRDGSALKNLSADTLFENTPSDRYAGWSK